MTIESVCYVCGKEMQCINGLCPDCTMAEFFNPGAAFAATFGSFQELQGPSAHCLDCGAVCESWQKNCPVCGSTAIEELKP